MTNGSIAIPDEPTRATGAAEGTPVWLITGCSSGLGRALAEHALKRGDRVAVTARDPTWFRPAKCVSSLWSRDVKSVTPVMAELGVGLVPYLPLGRGFLTGGFDPSVLAADDVLGVPC